MNLEEFKSIFGYCEISDKKLVLKSNLKRAIQFIKDNYRFNLLKEIVAIDNGNDSGIELIYRLYSLDNEEELLLSITVNNEAESISDIFDSAVADEKEIYDLFGIYFVGNQELKRLYMPETWQGHPLKKDYQQNDERLRWNDNN